MRMRIKCMSGTHGNDNKICHIQESLKQYRNSTFDSISNSLSLYHWPFNACMSCKDYFLWALESEMSYVSALQRKYNVVFNDHSYQIHMANTHGNINHLPYSEESKTIPNSLLFYHWKFNTCMSFKDYFLGALENEMSHVSVICF